MHVHYACLDVVHGQCSNGRPDTPNEKCKIDVRITRKVLAPSTVCTERKQTKYEHGLKHNDLYRVLLSAVTVPPAGLVSWLCLSVVLLNPFSDH